MSLRAVEMLCLDCEDSTGADDDVVHVESFAGNVVENKGGAIVAKTNKKS